MDSRLVLSDKQKKLIKQLEKLFKDLRNEKIGIIADVFDSYGGEVDFKFFNASNVLDWNCGDSWASPDRIENYDDEDADEGEIWYTPDPDDLESANIDIDMEFFGDDWFSVLLKKNEESDLFIRKRKKEELLAPLKKKLASLKEELQKHEDAYNGGIETVDILKERGVQKDIIDEEKANIDSNKKAIDELQIKIKDINREIRKVNAKKIK